MNNPSMLPLVRALEEAKLCGGVVNAEDVLQNVASRVQARQAQEMLQQLQAKNSSKVSLYRGSTQEMREEASG